MLAHFGGYVGLCWPMLGTMLAHLGARLAHLGAMLAYLTWKLIHHKETIENMVSRKIMKQTYIYIYRCTNVFIECLFAKLHPD